MKKGEKTADVKEKGRKQCREWGGQAGEGEMGEIVMFFYKNAEKYHTSIQQVFNTDNSLILFLFSNCWRS